MTTRFNLTKTKIAELPNAAPGTRAEYYDLQVKALMVRVTDSGHKTFYVRRKLDNKSERLKIGIFPETTLEEARRRALDLSASFSRGENPKERKVAARNQPTLGDLFDIYMEEYAEQRCLAAKEMKAVFRRYLSDWKDRKIASISPADVQRKMNQIGSSAGHVPANHALTYVKAAINWCIKNKVVSCENPFAGVRKFKTQPRERFIRPEELKRFFDALKKLPNDTGIRDYIYLSLFTGARQANVLAMRWEHIDFDLGIWYIPRTKSGDSQTLPLTPSALAILAERHNNITSEWVFPGEGKTGHLVDPKKGWYALLKESEIENLRMHDLRRTLGSYMAMGNQSLHMIGKVLGHKSAAATQIYSKVAHDPLRLAMQKAEHDMLAAAGLLSASEADDKS